MKNAIVHPSRNIDNPIKPFVNSQKASYNFAIKKALTLSYGFGGINTAVCLENY